MTTGKALLGVLTGIAAGAVLGILFAPEKRSDTKKNIVKKSEDLASSIDESINQKFDALIKKSKSRGDSVTSKTELVD